MPAPMPEFDADLVRRFDRNGPRYTSYPTADRFVVSFDEAAYRAAAARRNTGGVQRPLALYMHLPFCRDVCYYCACNKIVTRDAGKAARYLDYLGREIERQAGLFRDDLRVVQMHWGGGTPTYYNIGQLKALQGNVARHFDLQPGGEYSIEIDPRTVDAEAIHALRGVGFNRVSFGVQDFDSQVQIAIHRMQGAEQTRAAVDAARGAGFESVNMDLVYGLPRQTLATFGETLDCVLEMRPDRIALYNYAHIPTVFKAQRRIPGADLPSPDDKLRLLGAAIAKLGVAGYVHIGMDHFAVPEDTLALALRQGRLHRNFQGYSVQADADLVGLGVSAIGAIGPTYSQNHRGLDAYYAALDRGGLPVMRGIALSADDLARRAVIQALMCSGELAKDSIEVTYLVDFDRYFAAELEALREFERLGLVAMKDGWIMVTPRGRFLVRSICMVFDCHLGHAAGDGPRYSRVV
jgi:oxygen-independent coproporphyrinogen III oxidase